MKSLSKSIFLSLVLIAMAIGLSNCSQEDFGKSATNSVVSSSSTPPPPPKTTTTAPLPNAPLATTPSVTLSSQPCVSGNVCTMNADLSEPLNEELTAVWATDNTIYLQAPPAGVVYSIPDVDFVPTSGQITFPAGVTHTVITVQTIYDPQAGLGSDRSIVVQFSDCDYGGIEYTCTSLGM